MYTQKKLSKIFTLLAGFFAVQVHFSYAMVFLNNPTATITTLEDFIAIIIQIIQLIGIPMLAMCIIYAGFLIVTAAGNEDQVTKGKQWVLWTVVGATIVLGAQVIADFIFGTASLF